MRQLRCRTCQGEDFALTSAEIPVTVNQATLRVPVTVAQCVQCGYQVVDWDNAARLDAAYDQLAEGTG